MPSASAMCVLSLGLLLASFRLHGRGGRGEPTVLALLVVATISMLLFVLYFVADYFTANGINEAVVYHLRYGLSGAGFSEYAALAALALVAALAAPIFFWWLMTDGRQKAGRMQRGPGRVVGSLGLAALSLMLHPATADIVRMVPGQAPALAVFVTDETLQRERQVQEDFERHYFQASARPADGPRKNLVFIYAESLERTYFDETLFPGLMPRLRALESESLSFTGVVQAPGTGWTIAGMVASQCGIPLFTPSHGNSMSGLDSFLPAATCLGDLLKDDGYHLSYLGGAHLRFAGKGKFYQTHRFDEIAGLDELRSRQRDPAYVSAWGLYNDELLDLAYERYAALSRERERFGLFLLTLDTHHPDGHLSASCSGMRYGDGSNPMLNAVHCSDHLIAKLVDRIRHSEWGKRTLIVIASDHLAMRNTAYDLLERGTRRNLFMVVDPAVAGRKVPTNGSLLDVAPTVMEHLGHDAQLGLGNSLMQKDTMAADRRNYALGKLGDWVGPLTRFWDFPRIDKKLEIDTQARRVIIDGRNFAVPAFVTIDRDMRTTIKFPYLDSSRDFVSRNEPNKVFVLITECSSMDARLPADVDCLFAGTGNQWRTQLILRGKAGFLPEEIMRMAGAGS